MYFIILLNTYIDMKPGTPIQYIHRRPRQKEGVKLTGVIMGPMCGSYLYIHPDNTVHDCVHMADINDVVILNDEPEAA